MKNYRKLVPIVLIALLILSWYKLLSDKIAISSEYDTYIQQARKYAEQGITKYAMENYNLALAMNDNIELYVEIAEYYKGQGKFEEFLAWGEQAMGAFPTDARGYDIALEANYLRKDYESCYDVLKMAEKRGVTSNYIKETSNEIAYVYHMDYSTYDDVAIYSNNYCAVQSDGLWGFVDRYGKLRVACRYLEVGAYTQINFVSVINSDNEVYFIDKSGSKVLVMPDDVKKAGLLVDNTIAVEKIDGKYTYLNQDGQPVIVSENVPVTFDYASTMNYGVAAVKQGDVWSIINNEGKQIIDKEYKEVVLDEKGIAYRNERLFVKENDNHYIMIDANGKQIGDLKFEEAKLFGSGNYAAVKINGKWAFVDVNGKLISDKTYENARSFANGLAAVCIDEKWGFIDENENLVIENVYDDARDFNEKGSCFVKKGDSWQLLKLYRLNREE